MEIEPADDTLLPERLPDKLLQLLPEPLRQGLDEESMFRNLSEEFLRGKSPETQDAYQRGVNDFAAFLGFGSVADMARVLFKFKRRQVKTLAIKYREALRERGLSPRTINLRLVAIRSLFEWAHDMDLVPWTLKIKGITIHKKYRDTAGPGNEALLRMLELCRERQDDKGARDYAMLRLMVDRALRRKEVVSLDLADYDSKQCVVWVLRKQRSEKEKMTLAEPTVRAIDAWLERRQFEPGPLFTSLHHDPRVAGKRLTPNGLYQVVRQLGEAAGVRTWPHAVRHGSVTHALDRTGGDVRRVQKFSGHKSLDTLMEYDDNRRDHGGEIADLVADDFLFEEGVDELGAP